MTKEKKTIPGKIMLLLIMVFLTPALLFSQYNDDDNEPLDGHNYIRTHKSWMDFLPIDSILEKVWQVKVKNQNCLPLIEGNLIFPSVVERIVIDVSNGQVYDFGDPFAKKLFAKEKLDSIICFPAEDSICLINIYTDEVQFSNKRYLLPGYEGPFFPKHNVLYYSSDNILYAYNYLTKKNRWKTNIDKYTKNFYHSYKNYIIINDSRNLLIINKTNGEVIQSYKNRRYISDVLIGDNLYYSDSYNFYKVSMETFKKDTLVKSKQYIERTFTIEEDTIYYATKGKLNLYSLSKKSSKQLPYNRICSGEFIKVDNYIISNESEAEDAVFTTIYNLKKGLPIYKYFFIKQEGDFYTFDQYLYLFNPKLTDNGLLIGYTLRGDIQAFKFIKK